MSVVYGKKPRYTPRGGVWPRSLPIDAGHEQRKNEIPGQEGNVPRGTLGRLGEARFVHSFKNGRVWVNELNELCVNSRCAQYSSFFRDAAGPRPKEVRLNRPHRRFPRSPGDRASRDTSPRTSRREAIDLP